MTSKPTPLLRTSPRTPKSGALPQEPISGLGRGVRTRPLIIETGEEQGGYEGFLQVRGGEDGQSGRYVSPDDPEVRYPKTTKSQTPRNSSNPLKKPLQAVSQSISASSTPMNTSAKSVTLRGPQQSSAVDLHKPMGLPGTSTPRTASKPGTQRAVYNSLTQKKPLQPAKDPMLGSPRHSQASPTASTARSTPGQILHKSQSTGSVKQAPGTKGLSGMVTQVGASAGGRKMNLSPEQIKERSDRIYREHLFQTFQALKFVRTLPPADSAQLRNKRIFLEKRKGYASRKTLIFDLDETLVHCCENPSQSTPDVVLPITFPTGEVVNAGINIRPFAKECLTEANKLFEVIVFTASHQCYADVVLNYLDPTGELIHHRLYRDNCITVEGLFLKDLRIMANRRIQELVIVDNAAYSFAYQLDNGIPIISWHDDPYDRELFNLIDYMKILAGAEDIRSVNRETFHLNTFYEDYIDEFLSAEDRKARPTPRKTQ